jgi:hypothetical protein
MKCIDELWFSVEFTGTFLNHTKSYRASRLLLYVIEVTHIALPAVGILGWEALYEY